MAETRLLPGIFVPRRIQLLFESRYFRSRVTFFTFKPFEMRRNPCAHFRSAGNFISEPRLASDRFKLLLAQLLNCPVFAVPPLGEIGDGTGDLGYLAFHNTFFGVDSG